MSNRLALLVLETLQEEIKEEKPGTCCMDFDGVLCHHESEWPIENIGEPLKPAIELAKFIKACGHKLVILTSRPTRTFEAVSGWLEANGVEVDEVTNTKPPAFLYIDDRARKYPRNFAG